MRHSLRTFLILVTVFCLAAVSCVRKVQSSHPTVKYVNDILDSKSSREGAMLHQGLRRESDIAIIGTEGVCLKFSDGFLVCDVVDNVDGSRTPDGLPDFAGENLECIYDTLSYATYLAEYGEDALRTQTVRRVLAALDTVLHVSPYDIDGLDSKPTSKIVVLSDPFLVRYGLFDVDTLFRSTSCPVEVVAPVNLMYKRVFDAFPGKKVHVAVVCDSSMVDSGIYQDIFRTESIKNGALGSSIMPVAASDDSLFVLSMLEKFVNSGHADPLDAIIVDAINVDTDSLRLQLADALSVMNESSVIYGKTVSKDFLFVDAFDVVSSTCFDILRSRNLFTHNIARPEAAMYRPVMRPDASDGSIMLIKGDYVQN